MDDPFAIRDIASPVESLPGPPLWPWIAVLLVALLCGLLYWQRRRSVPVLDAEAVAEPTPLQRALAALDTLLADGLIEAGQGKRYFTRLNMILRAFLRDQFAVRAPHLTTSELRGTAALSRVLDDRTRKPFDAFLRACDCFKFADIAAQPGVARRAHDTCRELLLALGKDCGGAHAF